MSQFSSYRGRELAKLRTDRGERLTKGIAMTGYFQRALCASSALATGLLLASGALAQTTGSATVEEVVVTGVTGPKQLSGIIEQSAAKSKTAITDEYISQQMPGQTIADTLNVVPGYNFTNTDAYGNSGGNIRLRSFDCARISFQWDGMQLNDSGNYACFTNQVGDSEIIRSAEVSQGTTDVDAPSASATGGAINYRTKKPMDHFGGIADLQVGSFNFRRGYGELDTGLLGPTGISAFGSYSYTKYDKFKGPGSLEKKQFNARIYQPIGDNGDFAAIGFHWNENRNNFYRNPNITQYRQFGYKFDEDVKCTRPTPTAGTAQNDTTQSTVLDFLGNTFTGSCTNFANVRINPSNTGNVRGQFKYHLTDSLIFTFDPNFQYVLANGGGFTVVSETDNRLKGGAGPAGPGADLNGDGDTLDSVQLYTPNNTNTRRYGLNSSLIWDLNENHRFRLAYALDYARHRQTGEFSPVGLNGEPSNVFGGKSGEGPRVATKDGTFLRGRDRFSIAQLNMIAAEYAGNFMEDSLELRVGIRAPFFKRELNQFCYSQSGANAVLCTTQPVTTNLANGNVQFAGNANQFIKPYKAEKKYDKVLPNIGVSYKFGEGHSVYGSYAEGLSAPRTDNLYTVVRNAAGAVVNPIVQPETTKTIDIGYRYKQPNLLVSASLYSTKFQNRIVTSFDPDLGINIDRNIGDVDIRGGDAQVVWQPAEALTWIANISYNDSEVKSNIPLAGVNTLPTKGKQLVETAKWQVFERIEWSINDNLNFAVQSKYVGKRFATDVNDEISKPYATTDVDMRWKLPENFGSHTYLQMNVKNVFDVRYLASISTTTNAFALPGSNAIAPTYTLGSPRSYQLTLHTEF